MTTSNDKPDSESSDTKLDAVGKDQISESLKRVYDDIAKEPLPDQLADLLEKLKRGESA